MILLQAGQEYMQFVLLGGMILVFYLFFIRPQQKKAKDQKNFSESIKKGDSVVTTGGIHGKVFSVESDTVVLEVDRGLKLTFERSSISLEASKRVSDKASN
jgi:preprotein translocase subunit YajC